MTNSDRIAEAAGWLFLAGIWILTLLHYPHLPETIPTHFDLKGQADRFSSRQLIFILPVIATILFASMTVLNRFPHIFNYTTTITEENALREYTRATRLVRYLKLTMVLILGIVVGVTTAYA